MSIRAAGICRLFVLAGFSAAQLARADAGAIPFQHYTINDGLSQSSVQALLEDRRGFLWIGTQDGLNRFDGYRFTVFRQDPDDTNSLGANNVSSLYESSDGTLWAGTAGGLLHAFDAGREEFQRFPLPAGSTGEADPYSFDEVTALVETADGRLWVGTQLRGVLEFDRQSGRFQRIPGIPPVRVNAIVQGTDGELWIGTDGAGLLWHWPSSGETRAAEETASAARVGEILVTSFGEVWVSGPDSVFRYSAGRQLIDRVSLRQPDETSELQVRAMLEDRQKRIWVGSIDGGLRSLDRYGALLEIYLPIASDPTSLNSKTVYALLLDRSGVLWTGSLSAGLSKANLSSPRFEIYRHRPEEPQSLSHDIVNEFAEQGPHLLWVGTDGGGVSRLDRRTETFTHFRHDPEDPGTLSSDRVWGMHLGEDGFLWVGTWGDGLNRLDTATGRVRRIAAGGPEALPGDIVTTIVGDGAGGLWIGTADGGIARLSAGSDSFLAHPVRDAPAERNRPVNVADILLDQRGRLWVATWNQGLCMSLDHGRSFRCFESRDEDPRSINSNNVRAISEDTAGGIWFATASGIARYDETGQDFERFGEEDGLAAGTIYGVLAEDDKTLWLSSNHGLHRFEPADGALRTYNHRDGLPSNEFNGDAFLSGAGGTFFFGGIGGIVAFRPDALHGNPVPPRVVLTRLDLFMEPVEIGDGGEAVLDRSIVETDSIALDYAQNVITIEYAGLHFASPELNRYAHRLAGFDEDWIVRDADSRSATYTNLDPGYYEFRVRAANSDGIWSTSDRVLGIQIRPPWWMTIWARSLVVAAAALGLFALFRWRTNLLRQQTRLLEAEVDKRTAQIVAQRDTIEEQARSLEELLDSKNRFFARISHELRTPITLMLGPIDEQLERLPGDADRRGLEMARRNGRRLLHLLNQLLGLARSSSERRLELSPVDLARIVRLTADSFLPLAVRKGVALDIEAGDEVWVNGNGEGLQIVVSNLLSNAIKYTESHGTVGIAVAMIDGEARLTVRDDGAGIPAEYLDRIFTLFERGNARGEGSGIGLTLVKELVDAHGGSVSVSSREAEGTTVTASLPALPSGAGRADVAAILGVPETGLFMDPVDLPSAAERPEGEREIGIRVLIVEDNADMRSYVSSLLAADYDVTVAEDGTAGLELAKAQLPDIVISDIMMPGVDGFELLGSLRGCAQTSHIPVIMLTALDDQDSRIRGLQERADDYLAKPFDRRELRLRVRNLLELSRIRARRLGQLLYASDGSHVDMLMLADGLNERDREFLKRLEAAVEANYADAGFRLENLAHALFMSPRQLQRKLRALLDTSPAAYLRDFRLRKARAALLHGRTVSDVAFDTGFSSVSYFGRCFRTQFGVTPSEIEGQAGVQKSHDTAD